MIPTHFKEGNLLSPPIQMLISSDTPKNNVSLDSLPPVSLTHKIICHGVQLKRQPTEHKQNRYQEIVTQNIS